MAVRTINRSIAPVRASWDKKVWGKQERTPAGLPLYLEAKTRQGPGDFGQEEVNPTGDAGTVLEHPASTKKGLQKQEDFQIFPK